MTEIVIDRDITSLCRRLLLIRERLGYRTYIAAIRKAKVAVAQAALVEAERRSRTNRTRSALIIPFPTRKRRRKK